MTHYPHGLSVSIIARSGILWRWQLNVVQFLVDQQLIQVSQVISLGQPETRVPPAISFLHRLDAWVFRSPMSAFEHTELSRLGEVRTVSAVQLTECVLPQCDVVIDFTELDIVKGLLPLAKLGVLRADFSESGSVTSWYLGLSEYRKNAGQTRLAISLITRGNQPFILSEARPSLDRGSYTRNLNYYWMLSNHLWARAFKTLLQGGDINALSNALQTSNTSSRLEGESSAAEEPHSLATCSPGTFRSTKAYTSAYYRFASHLLAKLQQKFLSQEQWRILIRLSQSNGAEQGLPLAFGDYHELVPPADCFWADPFVVSREGRHFVFFEELPFATERGHLCCMEVFDDGSHSAPIIILKRNYHLSYPNVFEHESAFYMIPESGDNATIDLYRCTAFPYGWEFSHTLIKGLAAYDATLLEYDGRWWLFATVAIEAGCSGCEELHVFYADSPLSQSWQAHAQNPVISDASKARPAGQFFYWNDQLYRPSQDCAGSYGAGLNINRVSQLDPENYQEVTEQVCRPDWDPDLIALHTLNFNPHIAVADALRKQPRYRPK